MRFKNKIFSISKKQEGNRFRKIINILGIKFKMRNLVPEIDLLRYFTTKIFLISMSNDKYFYIKTDISFAVFSKEIFKYDLNLVENLLFDKLLNEPDYQLGALDKSNELYNAFENDSSLCMARSWLNQWNCIDKMFLKEKEGKLYLEKQILGIENIKNEKFKNEIVAIDEFREIYTRETIFNYIKNLGEEEKVNLFTQYFDWVYSNYTDKSDHNKVSNLLCDAYGSNILVKKNISGKYEFTLIDYSLVTKKKLDKSYVIWKMLNFDKKLMNYFLNKYNIKTCDTKTLGDCSYWPYGSKSSSLTDEELINTLIDNKSLIKMYLNKSDEELEALINKKMTDYKKLGNKV